MKPRKKRKPAPKKRQVLKRIVRKRVVRKRARVSPKRRSPARQRVAEQPHIPFPIALPGMRIGLFGGTFNPPHEAHRAASLLALKRLGLDRIWWLVTPGNPLKDNRALPSLQKRINESRKLAAHPGIVVTGLEAALGTRFTRDTVAKLQSRFPKVRFVLIVGADNLAILHRWKNWRGLAENIPIAVVDRPDYDLSTFSAPAPTVLARARIDESDAAVLSLLRPPAWAFLHGLKSELSSTALRRRSAAKRSAAKRKG